MRIFITGATGFIGREVCRASANHSLLLLCQPTDTAETGVQAEILRGDLGSIATWKSRLLDFRPEACIHLAWEGLPDYSLGTCIRNFELSMQFFELLREARCPRVVVTGTCWEYGSLNGAVDEEQMGDGLGQFAAFKTAVRVAGQRICAAPNCALLWARPFFVIGERQRATSLIPTVYQTLARGETPQVRTPDAANDFIHVEDVARGLALLATRAGPAGVYNLGTGIPTRVGDVVNLLARALRRPAVFPASDQPPKGAWADISKARRDYRWEPEISLEEALRRVVACWRTA